jgi:hypothetical protein
MFVEIEGTVPQRCFRCGGFLIENTKHECITGGWVSIKQEDVKPKITRETYDYQRGYHDGFKEGHAKALEDLQAVKQVQLGTNQVIIVKDKD